MKKILLIILSLFIVTSSLVFANQDKEQKKEGDFFMNKKILIVYYSLSGNTKTIAQKIQKQFNCDITSIEPQTPYPDDYNELAYGVAKMQKEKNIHPPIKKIDFDVKNYNIIFVGTPAWWYTMAPPVMTFLSQNDFEGKTVIPFITHGGGGKYNIEDDMRKLAKGSKVLTPFVVYEKGDENTDKALELWLKEFK